MSEESANIYAVFYTYTDTAGRTIVVERLVGGGTGDVRTIVITQKTVAHGKEEPGSIPFAGRRTIEAKI